MIMARHRIVDPPDNSVRWRHPVITLVGRQGGGYCSGDISDNKAEPSSAISAGGFDWEIYAFNCREQATGLPPAIPYDGRAAEAHAGDLVFAIVIIAPSGSGELISDIFQKAFDSFIALR